MPAAAASPGGVGKKKTGQFKEPSPLYSESPFPRKLLLLDCTLGPGGGTQGKASKIHEFAIDLSWLRSQYWCYGAVANK